MLINYLVNPLKFLIPGLLLFHGCRTTGTGSMGPIGDHIALFAALGAGDSIHGNPCKHVGNGSGRARGKDHSS